MIEYKDPIPPILKLLIPSFQKRGISIYGSSFPTTNVKYPAVVIRTAGGIDYYRIQLWSRANNDIQAMTALIDVMNDLEKNAQYIQGLMIKWCQRESNPIPDVDEDTGLFEAWCYMRLEAYESYSI